MRICLPACAAPARPPAPKFLQRRSTVCTRRVATPAGECEICKGIDNGSLLDVVEMDAASNNGVDDIRDLRDETAYTPSACQYKVYIIDEVHMLSTAAFNALLKTLEEPPAHVIFILATTEIQKVPATILSRCQRYDFTRIGPEDIARRVEYIAGEEKLELTSDGAELIARLADGALRDALSILDTCAGVTAKIDADVVRRMAGVTDRSYLFHISDALEAQDAAAALAQLAQLRQQSVDVKRLTEELIAHYRALMLAALPGGQALLSGVSPEEEALYLQKGPEMGQREAIRAIRTLGHGAGTHDPRQRPAHRAGTGTVQPVRAAPADAGGNGATRPCPHGTAGSTPSLCGSGAALCQCPGAACPGSSRTPDPGSSSRTCPCCAGDHLRSLPHRKRRLHPTDELPPMPEEPPVQQSDAALPWDEPAPQAPPPEQSEPVEPAGAARPCGTRAAYSGSGGTACPGAGALCRPGADQAPQRGAAGHEPLPVLGTDRAEAGRHRPHAVYVSAQVQGLL